MSQEIVNIRINKEPVKGKLKWYSYHAGEVFEAIRTPYEDFFCYHLTEKSLEKLEYLNKEKNVDKGKSLSAVIYSDCCVEIMYLIYARPDAHWEENVLLGYANSEQEAKADCEKRTKRYEIYKEVKEKINALVNAVDETEGIEGHIAVPKWEQGMSEKDITVEMRAERNGINKQNEAINERNGIKYTATTNEQEKVREDYFNLLDYDEYTMKYLRKHILGGYMSGLYLSGYEYETVNRI